MKKPPDAFEPIYQRLYERYKSAILELRLRPGERIDSIAEIQRKHGVARDTAKRALRMLAEGGYIVQRPGKGSFVADARPTQSIWGLVFPFFSVQYEDLILRIAERAARAGRELRRVCDHNSYEEEIRLVGEMIAERFEAVLVIPTFDESKTWPFYSRLSPRLSPIVLLDHTMSCNDFRYVVQSYDLGVTRAIEYLLRRKPGAVGFVLNETWGGRNMVLELMRGTYLDFIRRERPGFEPLFCQRASDIRAAELRARGVTGLFCCDDVGAIQAIGRLREQGADVPDDFSVVSYGNTDLSRFFTPAITSVDPRNEEMADALAALIAPQGRLAAVDLRAHVALPELVIRAT